MQTEVLRLALGRLFAELLLGFVVARAIAEGRLAGALVAVAAIVGVIAGSSVSLEKRRRPQRAAHLVLIGAALSIASLRVEMRMGTPSGVSLAPAALLGGAGLLDIMRERAARLKEPLRIPPMSVLSVFADGALNLVLEGASLARSSALALALALTASASTLAATFLGGPNRPIAKPFDAAVFVAAGLLSLVLLAR